MSEKKAKAQRRKQPSNPPLNESEREELERLRAESNSLQDFINLPPFKAGVGYTLATSKKIYESHAEGIAGQIAEIVGIQHELADLIGGLRELIFSSQAKMDTDYYYKRLDRLGQLIGSKSIALKNALARQDSEVIPSDRIAPMILELPFFHMVSAIQDDITDAIERRDDTHLQDFSSNYPYKEELKIMIANIERGGRPTDKRLTESLYRLAYRYHIRWGNEWARIADAVWKDVINTPELERNSDENSVFDLWGNADNRKRQANLRYILPGREVVKNA